MYKLPRLRGIEWLPTALLLVVVLVGGARLIYLSVLHHAAAARETAARVAGEFVRRIEPELQKIVDAASSRAAAGPGAPGKDEPHPESFWMSADDRVLRAAPDESATADGIAREWRAAGSVRTGLGATVLGPMRLGSEWLVAARVPLLEPGSGDIARLKAWSVAFANLDELLVHAHVDQLAEKGYDFEISQVDPRSSRVRVFLGSVGAEPLADAVAVRIDPPAGTAPAIPGSYLQMAIRPRAGWYPAVELASDIGLLTFLAWLIAFGTQELSHELQAARAAAGSAQRRLRTVSQHLATEMQQRVTLQETFDHARFHDAFTGLPNRRYFMDQLDRALRDLRAKQRQRIGVIIVDISRFKLVNDMLGHTAGDELMVEASRRFGKLIAPFEGVLARWSGDQFALLLLDVASSGAALEVGGMLLEGLRAPFELRRHRLMVTAAVGLTTAESGQQRAEDVVREADLALSVAKRNSSTRIMPYAANMAGQAASLVSLEADLHVAMEKRQLQLVFQPIVNLRTYHMVGAEALLRWRHPVESVLAPDKFLRIAEEAGLMVPITRWIVFRVVKLAAQWRRQLPANQDFFISMNISPTALQDAGLGDHIAALLRDAGLPASVLKFELTEAALISNAAAARDTMDRLHAMGVQLMLDDFGTGYSSLSYLQLFPFDFVKIDRPFVNRAGADQANSGMMAAMVQMAESLNLTAIAEIIETEAAAKALRAMGCEYGQGYYFSAPLEADLALQRLLSQDPFEPQPQAQPVPQPQAQSLPQPQAQPLPDTAATVMVRPLPDTEATVMVSPLPDTAATVMVSPLPDTADTVMVSPLPDTADTVMVSPLPDTADTVTVRPLPQAQPQPQPQPQAQPLPDTAATVMLRPLPDTADTVMVRPLPDTEATVAVRPLPDTESTVMVMPLPDTAATVILRPLRVDAGAEGEDFDDDSPTLMLPASDVKFSSEDADS